MTLTHLEMTAPDQVRPSASDLVVTLAEVRGATVRELTLAIGAPFDWPSRAWAASDWDAYLADPGYRHWAGRHAGGTIGLVSVHVAHAPTFEVDSFGVLPHLIGQGLGGPFLTACLGLLWDDLGARRVWLHTSSNDHPNALTNYLARGFVPFPPGANPSAHAP